MAIAKNSYGSAAAVATFCREFVGSDGFDTDSHPTLSEVEDMIDRVSASLNVALSTQGLSIPVSQADAKLACDEWVITKVARFVHLARNVTEEDEKTSSEVNTVANAALEFSKKSRLGFIRLGVSEANSKGEGLTNTAEGAPAQRADRSNTSLAQPKFSKGMIK